MPIQFSSPQARDLYESTLQRAAARVFIFEWSSQEEAENQIAATFYVAANVNEMLGGSPISITQPQLDENEARLATALLNITSDGETLIAADEARNANQTLARVISYANDAPLYGQSYSQRLMNNDIDRSVGWRRLRREMTIASVRSFYHSSLIRSLDPLHENSGVASIFASAALCLGTGGLCDRSLRIDSIWNTSNLVGRALQMLPPRR